MSKNSKGVYQLENGYWGFRYTYTINEKKKDVKKTKDEFGNRFKTEKQAIKAREAAMLRDKFAIEEETQNSRITFGEVYNIYCECGRGGKAYSTIKKQDSLWENHLKGKFGKRFIDDISVAEINDYLTTLYYKEGRSFMYVEGFLKMFYLIFGQAYSRNYLDTEILSMVLMCLLL